MLKKRLEKVVRGFQKNARKVTPGGLCIALLAWTFCNYLWPIQMPESGACAAQDEAVISTKTVSNFEGAKVLIRSKELFAPPTPILSNSAGAVVVEELLKKIQLAGISNVGGQPAAVIRMSGKSGMYKAGDALGSFVVKEIEQNKVILEIDGQPVDLSM